MEWTAAKSCGYGNTVIAGRNVRVHRVAWELANGPIPEGLHVLHKCDNRACLNPAHLFLGTNADNVADRTSKGRGVNPVIRGEAHYAAKLPDETIAGMHARRALGWRYTDIAAWAGCSANHVGSVIRGERRAEVAEIRAKIGN